MMSNNSAKRRRWECGSSWRPKFCSSAACCLAYSVYRSMYFPAFAEASRQLDVVLGSLNTAVLLCSSLTMAMAVHQAESGNEKWLVRFLGVTMLLGTVFLGDQIL